MTKQFQTIITDEKDKFSTGSHRGSEAGKPRYDLIPHEALYRLAMLYSRGTAYGEDNWRLGQPLRRVYSSLFRHLMAWASGDRSEDHLAAVIWNAISLMIHEQDIKKGVLDINLADKMPEVRQALVNEMKEAWELDNKAWEFDNPNAIKGTGLTENK